MPLRGPLLEYGRRPSASVFAHPFTGNPLDGSKLLKRFMKAWERAAVRPVRCHGLRQTFGTRVVAAGVNTPQEWFGYRNSKTTDIYADYQPDQHEAEWVERAFSVSEREPPGRSGPRPSASETADN